METFCEAIRNVLNDARQTAYRAVNFAVIEAYWRIGHMIVEEEQQGNSRAEYGSGLLKYLAQRLTEDFGERFDELEMSRIRQFYLMFPIRDAVRHELTWTHYRLLSRVVNEAARAAEIKHDVRLLEQNRHTE